MIVGTPRERPRTIEELLGPALAARLDRLDVVSRKVFAGKLPGERRSKKRGQSVEFDDYRSYVAGDDLRHIDWNVFARMDRFFVKLFREEEDLSLHVAIDASPSMDAGTPNKLLFAQRLAMALGYIGLVNLNRVSVSAFGLPRGRGVVRLAPMRGRRNVERLARFIMDDVPPEGGDQEHRSSRAAIGGTGSFAACMRDLASARHAKGVVVVISDFLFREGYQEGLNMLGAAGRHGWDAYCLHVLSPGELDPGADREAGVVGDLRLMDVESGDHAEVTVSAALLKKYRENVDRFCGGLRRNCAARGMSYVLLRSDTNLETLLLEYLRKRGLLG